MCDSGEREFESSEQLAEYHQNLCNTTKELLRTLLSNTPLLRDIDDDVTQDELTAEIAFINGDSMKIYVQREPYEKLKVIVPRQCKVRELKATFQHCFEAYQRRQAKRADNDKSKHSTSRQRHHTNRNAVHNVNISWKYIWRTYYLRYNGIALIDDEKLLSEYDIRSKAILDFVKKIKINRKTRKTKHREHK